MDTPTSMPRPVPSWLMPISGMSDQGSGCLPAYWWVANHRHEIVNKTCPPAGRSGTATTGPWPRRILRVSLPSWEGLVWSGTAPKPGVTASVQQHFAVAPTPAQNLAADRIDPVGHGCLCLCLRPCVRPLPFLPSHSPPKSCICDTANANATALAKTVTSPT